MTFGARSLLLAVVLAWAGTLASAEGELPRAQELIDAGRLEDAAVLLDRLLERDGDDAAALLLRSTLRFMEGEVEAGRRELERALSLDPGLRQGWLNRAALDLSERRFEPALEALEKARELDPEAVDNPLNIGAVLVLQGRLPQASEQFREYLTRTEGSAEAYLIVASNFAMGGYAGLALRHLERAVELDERTRRRARTDPNFAALASDPEFQRLLAEDRFVPPPGSHRTRRVFEAAYEGGRGKLLQAVMNALQLSGRSFDPQVEVTAGWSLIWSDFRIKVEAESETAGAVELTAPADRFSPGRWQSETEAFFREITLQLVRMKRPF